MRYQQQLNLQKRKRFLFRVRIFLVCFIIVLVGASSYIYYSVLSRQNSNTEESTTSQVTSGYFASSVKVFRSSYFQFQADNTWAEVPVESTPTKFVYRSMRANLIDHELIVYVDSIPPNLASNRVLPVNLKSNDSELLPISVSEHCMKAAGGSTIKTPAILLDNTTMNCDADSTNYTVTVGLAKGSTVLDLMRPDGTRTKYAIHYTNLKATPESSQIIQIVDSFQTR